MVSESNLNNRIFPCCATCGIPIRWQPTIIDSQFFCCLGCACGGPCTCDYDHLPTPDRKATMVVWKKVEMSTEIIRIIKED